jgi:hypothetical protein
VAGDRMPRIPSFALSLPRLVRSVGLPVDKLAELSGVKRPSAAWDAAFLDIAGEGMLPSAALLQPSEHHTLDVPCLSFLPPACSPRVRRRDLP